ncbi:acyl-ACP thioesterase [Sphaerochaeta pleomorpha str. Grapes]|uniref:Acyl-ACP thioesterase n=1 Tax=Sphaerochaeta pleomorpha (strain ATCC BAA-1885 / DSM 22778 / Grapes) TaxID=158190 RepID=G8QR01_SPHPG|nr:acyl-ACP thioesterase domain-containing protein [Sphaerochaeta pleomorpha]AEV29849.1 acyl-ACP thioesterase [Sphaerochaeta pleomorpha str. Grapes]
MEVSFAAIDQNNVSHSKFMTYSYETDSYYYARLAFYFEIVQEAAGLHAACRGCSIPEMHKEGKTWVITRSQIHIDRYTRWPETISIETWAQKPLRLHLPRVIRGVDEKKEPVFTATTFWAVLDIEHNGRPCRPGVISERIGQPPEELEQYNLDVDLKRRPTYEESGCTTLSVYKPTIQYLDSDSNQHINNISYLNWAMESLPDAFRNRVKVSDIDVSWIRQTFAGDTITVYTGSLDAEAFQSETPVLFHKIVRTEKDLSKTTVWEGMTTWQKRPE